MDWYCRSPHRLALVAAAATWTTTAQFGQYNFSTGYAVNNDCWCSGYATLRETFGNERLERLERSRVLMFNL
jgi:hypothetical protein